MVTDALMTAVPSVNNASQVYESTHAMPNASVLYYLDTCYSSAYCDTGLSCCLNYNSYQEDMCTYSYNCYSNSAYTFGYGPNGSQIGSIIASTICCIVFWSAICIIRRRRVMR